MQFTVLIQYVASGAVLHKDVSASLIFRNCRRREDGRSENVPRRAPRRISTENANNCSLRNMCVRVQGGKTDLGM
jgi:hypothetical protein